MRAAHVGANEVFPALGARQEPDGAPTWIAGVQMERAQQCDGGCDR
jgi:hypothetical protein